MEILRSPDNLVTGKCFGKNMLPGNATFAEGKGDRETEVSGISLPAQQEEPTRWYVYHRKVFINGKPISARVCLIGWKLYSTFSDVKFH